MRENSQGLGPLSSELTADCVGNLAWGAVGRMPAPYSSFPRKREPSYSWSRLGPRFRGDDEGEILELYRSLCAPTIPAQAKPGAECRSALTLHLAGAAGRADAFAQRIGGGAVAGHRLQAIDLADIGLALDHAVAVAAEHLVAADEFLPALLRIGGVAVGTDLHAEAAGAGRDDLLAGLFTVDRGAGRVVIGEPAFKRLAFGDGEAGVGLALK